MAKAPDHAVRALASIAERMLRDMGDHAHAKLIHGQVSRLRGAAESLDNVRRNKSPLDTQEAHALKVGRLAKKLDKEVTAMLNRTADHFRAGLADIDRRIAEKVDLRPNAFAEEYRRRFVSMGRKEQLEWLGRFVNENRGPELGAILRASDFLTGLSDEDRANYEAAIFGKHAPEEIAEREALETVMSAAQTASVTAGNIAHRFADPRQLEAIERAEAEANAAGEAFDQSLQ